MSSISVIGHRGARNLAPENTVPSIQAAIDLSMFGVEFDITLSKDGIPFLAHQETLAPDQSGMLELVGRNPSRSWAGEHTFAELRRMDAGKWYGPDFVGVSIPSYEEVLSLDWADSRPIMELIDASFWKDEAHAETPEARKLLSACLPLYKKYQHKLPQAHFLSFNAWILEQCMHELPEVPRILAVWKNDQDKLAEVIERAQKIKAEHVTLADFMLLSKPAWIEQIHLAGLGVWAYDLTPDLYTSFKDWSPESRIPVWTKLVELGVDGITCDFPNDLTTLLESLCSS